MVQRKKCIPKGVRDSVWNLYIGRDVARAVCLCCEMNEIWMQDFDCGHVVSEASGGSVDIMNLRPICHPCNLSMGVMNMDEYKRLYGYDGVELPQQTVRKPIVEGEIWHLFTKSLLSRACEFYDLDARGTKGELLGAISSFVSPPFVKHALCTDLSCIDMKHILRAMDIEIPTEYNKEVLATLAMSLGDKMWKFIEVHEDGLALNTKRKSVSSKATIAPDRREPHKAHAEAVPAAEAAPAAEVHHVDTKLHPKKSEAGDHRGGHEHTEKHQLPAKQEHVSGDSKWNSQDKLSLLKAAMYFNLSIPENPTKEDLIALIKHKSFFEYEYFIKRYSKWNRMTVIQLKAACEYYGEKKTGLKDDIILRLVNHSISKFVRHYSDPDLSAKFSL